MTTWDTAEAARIWRQGAARRARALAVATERMLDAAGLAPGMRVLDVAAGTGDQTILAAHIVGPSGSVLATDISASMLEAAAEAAREVGLANVTTVQADASALELREAEFDAAICRFGLMFVPDLHQALTRVRHALKPGARFAALVWSTEQHNPWIGVQVQPVRDMERMPDPAPTIVRTTSLSHPGKLERVLADAGFDAVSVSTVPVPRDFESLEEAWTALQASSPTQGELTRALTEAERERYAAEVRRALAAFVQSDGRCAIPGEALVVRGSKP